MLEGSSPNRPGHVQRQIGAARVGVAARTHGTRDTSGLRDAEIDVEKQARDEAARGRHEDAMSPPRAIRKLLDEHRASPIKRKKWSNAPRKKRGGMKARSSKRQDTVTSLHDE